MTFGQAITTVLRKYADFTGTARRPEFWWWFLFHVLVSAALSVFNVVALSDTVTLGSVLVGLWGLAVLVPNLAVAVRRLRDAGHAWPHLFWLLLPVIGYIVLAVLLSQPSKTSAA